MKLVMVQDGLIRIENKLGAISEKNNRFLKELALYLKSTATGPVTREVQAHGTVYVFPHPLDKIQVEID